MLLSTQPVAVMQREKQFSAGGNIRPDPDQFRSGLQIKDYIDGSHLDAPRPVRKAAARLSTNFTNQFRGIYRRGALHRSAQRSAHRESLVRFRRCVAPCRAPEGPWPGNYSFSWSL